MQVDHQALTAPFLLVFFAGAPNPGVVTASTFSVRGARIEGEIWDIALKPNTTYHMNVRC